MSGKLECMFWSEHGTVYSQTGHLDDTRRCGDMFFFSCFLSNWNPWPPGFYRSGIGRKLRNGYVDLKMSPEPPSTVSVVLI